jgi:hypothetical protein
MSTERDPRLLSAEHLRLIRSSLGQRSASYLGMIDAENDVAMLLADHDAQAEQIARLTAALEEIAKARAESVWTREVPTVEGSYWVRQRIGGPWVSYFSQADLEDRIRSPKNYLRLEFAGPLTPPAEPDRAREMGERMTEDEIDAIVAEESARERNWRGHEH